MRKKDKVEVACGGCDQIFLTDQWRLKRVVTGKVFCSKDCWKKYYRDQAKLDNPILYKKYKFKEFGRYVYRAKQGAKRFKDAKVFNITPEYLSEVWEAQEGRCPYTGIKLALKGIYRDRVRGFSVIRSASLDRIDSSKGYEIGNVQFVSLSMNYAKMDGTDEEVKELIRLIKEGDN